MSTPNRSRGGGPLSGLLAIVLLTLAAGCAGRGAGDAPPLALVYRGPGGCPSCSDAAAALLRSTDWGFEVRFIGPDEDLQLSAANLEDATLYVQPGGDGTLEDAYAALEPNAAAIRDYVDAGGRYLGLCMGGYLAGHGPGFDLLPGDSDQFITSDGASVSDEADTVVAVTWRDEPRSLYFQDGPLFILDRDEGGADADVLARYTNGGIAALVSPYGEGMVAVSGPHPEATTDWYELNDVTDPDGLDTDLGRELVDALMTS